MLPKPRLRFDLVVAAIFAALAATFLYKDLAAAKGNVLPGGVMLGRDFANAWAGARLTLNGRVGDIYSSHYMASLDQLTGHSLSIHAFSYPPSALLFLWPLGFLPYVAALVLFLLATGTVYLFAARPYLARAGLPLWTAALLPASILNVWAGHYGFLFSALWLAAFSAMDKRPLRAGGLLALLTFKPHMGVLIPLLLLLRQRWQAILAAAAGTLVLVGLSVALFGTSAWVSYLTGTSRLQMHLLVKENAFFFSMMPTAYSTVFTALASMKLAIVAQCVTALAALVIIVRATRSGIGWTELGLMASTATFLVLPYAFNYDMEVVGIAAAVLLFDRKRQLDIVGRVLALLALGVPVLILMLSPHTLPVLPVALLGFLWVQARAYGVFSREAAPAAPALAA